MAERPREVPRYTRQAELESRVDGTLAIIVQKAITMNWFGKKKDSGSSSSAPSGGGGGGGGDPAQTIVKLREAVATQEKR